MPYQNSFFLVYTCLWGVTPTSVPTGRPNSLTDSKVDKKEIDQCFNQGKFKAALDGLEQHSPSAWRDTSRLRCLRSMGSNAKALTLANELQQQLLDETGVYNTTRSERNHQSRYIALVFSEMGRAKEAAVIMKDLVEQSPNLAALRREYAYALNSDGQLDIAEQELKKALLLQPSNANAHAQLARIYCRTGRVQAGYDGYSRAASLDPDNPEHLERLIYWSNYLSANTQQSNYQLTQLWAGRAYPNDTRTSDVSRSTEPNRQLKIGLVSSDFCAHSSSFFIKPLLRGLDRKDFHITGYSVCPKSDAVTAQLKGLCDDWHNCKKSSTEELAAQISADQIDILIDLNGHNAGNRLQVFTKQSAPLQVSWLGYPSTTGLKSMGYRITDRVADPIGVHDEFYSEKLLRLPNGFLCYEPLTTAPDIAPAAHEGGIRFGSFNNLAKVSDLTLDCWAAALHAAPDSTLYLKRQQLDNEGPRQHLKTQLVKRGIDEARLIMHTSKATIEEHLDEYNQIDIALDTSPYNGTTATLEALWMGVPVISLQGKTHASRVTASILYHLELDEFAVNSVQEFAGGAKKLAQDPAALNQLKSELRSRMQQSALLDYKRFGRDFGNALRGQWHEWCRQQDQSAAKTSSKTAEQVTEVAQ